VHFCKSVPITVAKRCIAYRGLFGTYRGRWNLKAPKLGHNMPRANLTATPVPHLKTAFPD
jgi:hypothetical protein